MIDAISFENYEVEFAHINTVAKERVFVYFRKITVHDTNPELFRLFLEYVYSGQLDLNEMSTEQLADMITLADRYDVCVFLFSDYATLNS